MPLAVEDGVLNDSTNSGPPTVRERPPSPNHSEELTAERPSSGTNTLSNKQYIILCEFCLRYGGELFSTSNLGNNSSYSLFSKPLFPFLLRIDTKCDV